MPRETEKSDNASPAPGPFDPFDAEYRELMKLAGLDGCILPRLRKVGIIAPNSNPQAMSNRSLFGDNQATSEGVLSTVSFCFANEFTELYPQGTRQRVSNLYPHADLAEFNGAYIDCLSYSR